MGEKDPRSRALETWELFSIWQALMSMVDPSLRIYDKLAPMRLPDIAHFCGTCWSCLTRCFRALRIRVRVSHLMRGRKQNNCSSTLFTSGPCSVYDNGQNIENFAKEIHRQLRQQLRRERQEGQFQ
eukprot:1905446-Amphidinium_carterae.1